MIVRELLAKLGFDFDDSEWKKAEKATDMVKDGLEKLATAAAAATAALAAAVVRTANESGRLADLAQKTGVATAALQELEYAVSLNDISTEQFAASMNVLAKNLSEAANGGEQQIEAFARAGLSIRNARGELKTADVVLTEVAERFRKMPDGPRKAGMAMDLFGRSGAALIPVLNQGRDGLEELRQEARDLGIVMDEEAIAAGDRLGDNLDRLKALADGLIKTIAGPLLEPLAELADRMLAWAKANREVIKTRIQAFMRGLIATVRALAGAAAWVIDNWKLLAILLTSVVSAALIMHAAQLTTIAGLYAQAGLAAMLAGFRAAAAWIAAAAPAVLLTAIIAALLLMAEDVYTFLQGGDSLIGELGPKWRRFLDDFGKAQHGDPWWLEMLRASVRFVSDLETNVPKALKQLQAEFAIWFSWLVENAVRVGEVLVSHLSMGLVNPKMAQFAGAAAMRFAGGGGLTNPVAGGLAVGQFIADGFGGGSSPKASAEASPAVAARPVVAAPNINAPITVNAAPGMDEGALAGKVREQVDDAIQKSLREAAAATQ